MFFDGYSWGPIKSVNLQIAGEFVHDLRDAGDRRYELQRRAGGLLLHRRGR